MKKFIFSRSINRDFSQILTHRVNQYFRDNQIRQEANSKMLGKTIMALTLYFVPYTVIIFSGISSIPFLMLMWFLMGLALTFIGTSIMHDALHGSYSKNKYFNKILGLTAVIIGADATIWKIQHNGLHHSFTNIEHADDDIQMDHIFRLTPHQDLKWYHRFQHLYAVLFYSLSTIFWVTIKDYTKARAFLKKGLIKPGFEYRSLIAKITFKKLIYHFFFLFIPIMMSPVAAWITILMFLGMHLLAGVLVSLIFQTAHIMPEMTFIDQEDKKIEESWTVHQLNTTTNFAPKNKILSWFIGGLNYQIEHHLFPNICHIHYAKIATIVKQTTKEYQLPYHQEKSFRSAISSHFGMLKKLGRD